MKFPIIFIFLAAAASLGLAEPHRANSQKNQTDAPTNQTDTPTTPTDTPTTPTYVPSDTPTDTPTNQTDTPANQTPDLSTFATVANATANNPITELLKLSPECQTGLFTIVANPEFLECVPIAALLPLLPLLSDPSGLADLLKDPVHNLPPVLDPVLDGVCAAPKCSDDGVAGALQTIQTSCKKDAKNPLIVMITGVITFYSPLRDSLCFKTNKGEYCVIDTVDKIFTLPAPPVKILGGIIDKLAFAEPRFICTPCNKAILNTVFKYLDADKLHSVEFLQKIGFNPALLSLAKLGVALKCGFQFLDGKVGDPEHTDPDNFEYQLSFGDVPVVSSGASLQGFGFMTMIGALLASTLMI